MILDNEKKNLDRELIQIQNLNLVANNDLVQLKKQLKIKDKEIEKTKIEKDSLNDELNLKIKNLNNNLKLSDSKIEKLLKKLDNKDNETKNLKKEFESLKNDHIIEINKKDRQLEDLKSKLLISVDEKIKIETNHNYYQKKIESD